MPNFSSVKNKLFKSISRSDESQTSCASSSSASGAASNTNSNNASNESDDPPAYTPPAPASESLHPPAYTPAPVPTPQSTAGVHQGVSVDAVFPTLAKFKIIVVIDDSASMSKDLLRKAASVVKSIAAIITKNDKDGIDIHFLNHKSETDISDDYSVKYGYYNMTQMDMVEGIFNRVKPYGATSTGRTLKQVLLRYMNKLRDAQDLNHVRPIKLIVMTDGAPSDDPKQEIEKTVKDLDDLKAPPDQVGIHFFQIGSDTQGTGALQELDHGLSRSDGRKIVDTTPRQWKDEGRQHAKELTGENMLEIVSSAVDK